MQARRPGISPIASSSIPCVALLRCKGFENVRGDLMDLEGSAPDDSAVWARRQFPDWLKGCVSELVRFASDP